MTESSRTTTSGKAAPPPKILGPAILSALSLTVPSALYLVALLNPTMGIGAVGNAATIGIVAALGALYVFLVLHARRSGPAIVAGVSTSLGVVGALALAAAILLAKLDAMLGGSGSGALVVVALVYLGVQFIIARAARNIAGNPRMRSDGAYQLGIAMPLLFAIGVSAARSIPRRLEVQRFVADKAAQEQARSDLFALFACATAHRALDMRHDYPASLKALGPDGDKCLPGAVANGERGGWTFAYAARPSTSDSAAAFTVRATPLRGGETAVFMTIDQNGLVRDDWLHPTTPTVFRRDPPGLEVVIAMQDCEPQYRETHGGAQPPTLSALRAFADSTWRMSAPRCNLLRNLDGRIEWAQFGRRPEANEWRGKEYRVVFHPAGHGDSSVVAWEARPVTFGATAVWSYLALSSGTVFGTTEPRAATTNDPIIPRCEFGAPPAGAAQCVPGSSPPPDATLVVDSVVPAAEFTVRVAGATDSTPEGTATGFQYAISCDGLQSNDFVKDSSRSCRAPWNADSLQLIARVRNRDLATSEYKRWVRVKQPPLRTTLAAPKPIVLGDLLELKPENTGRNPRDYLDYTIRVGDAPARTRSLPANQSAIFCRATTSQQSSDCDYPAKPGKYEVRLTVRGRGDSTTAVTEAVITAPQLLRLPATANGTVHVGGAGEFLVLELLASWPAEHGQTRLVRDALGAGDIGPEPPRIGSVEGIFAERAERAADGQTVIPVAFRWTELVQAGIVKPGMREIVVTGRRGHVNDFVPYRQVIAVNVEK